MGFHPGRLRRIVSNRTDNKALRTATRNVVVDVPKDKKSLMKNIENLAIKVEAYSVKIANYLATANQLQ